MKSNTATVDDVEKALEDFKAAVAEDSSLEGLYGKKLAVVVDALTPKDGVTKLLNQQYGYGEKWWAKNVMDGEAEGCTKDNKLEKIKQYILRSNAYNRLHGDPKITDKVVRWMSERFPELVDAS